MKKFISYTLHGKTFIYECEVSIFSPRPYNLKPGEELYKVESPTPFKDELWYSMFFRDSVEQCMSQVEENIRHEFARLARKCCGRSEKECFTYTEEDIQKQISEVQVVLQ